MSIYQKLLEVQKEIKGIKKDATNPFFKSKYFDINSLLAEVKPILNKHDLVLLQPLTHIDGKLAIRTTIVSKDKQTKPTPDSQDQISSEIISNVCPIPDLGDPQKQGSAITYFRRYALQSLLALEAEDDDGNTATNKKEEGLSEVAFGKLRNQYRELGKMTPDMQLEYEKCSYEQKKRLADVTKDLRNPK